MADCLLLDQLARTTIVALHLDHRRHADLVHLVWICSLADFSPLPSKSSLAVGALDTQARVQAHVHRALEKHKGRLRELEGSELGFEEISVGSFKFSKRYGSTEHPLTRIGSL